MGLSVRSAAARSATTPTTEKSALIPTPATATESDAAPSVVAGVSRVSRNRPLAAGVTAHGLKQEQGG